MLPARFARPASQQAPSSDRYREIQQALQERGYYQGAVDGVWNAESVEALKRFQSDQTLKADGKLDSLSLIALGLGPRRDQMPTSSQPPMPEVAQ